MSNGQKYNGQNSRGQKGYGQITNKQWVKGKWTKWENLGTKIVGKNCGQKLWAKIVGKC